MGKELDSIMGIMHQFIYLKALFLQGGDSLDPVNYRPITVPSNILRLLTVRMCKKMTKVAEEQKMIGDFQFGFRQGKSTTDAVFVLTTLLKKAKIKSRHYATAFIDIAKV